jgi:uncharacterized membrane protein
MQAESGSIDTQPSTFSRVVARGNVGVGVSVIIALAFSVFYAWGLHLRWITYDMSCFDLGLIGQVAWNNLHGNWFATSIMPFNYLAEHFSPALVLVAPVLALFPSLEVLTFVQALAVGIAGIGVYGAGRGLKLDQPTSLALQLAFLLAPVTAWNALDEFHPAVLAIPAITISAALMWRQRYTWAALVAALGLLANEDVAFWVAPFGLLLILVGRRRGLLPGAALAVVAIAWLAAYLFLLVPAVRPADVVPHPDIRIFSTSDTSVSSLAGSLLLDPAGLAQRATTPGDFEALFALFGPTAFLGLFGPSFLASIPRWLVLLLGKDPPYYQAHYAALLVPAVYIGAVETVSRLRRFSPIVPQIAAVIVLVASLAGFVLASPLPGGAAFKTPSPEWTARLAVMDQAVRLIPRDSAVSVASSSAMLTHLALRSNVYLLFEDNAPSADYRIFDLHDPYPVDEGALRRHLAISRADPAYGEVFNQDEIVVLKRGSYTPQHSANADFGGQIALKGYDLVQHGETITVIFWWQALSPMPVNYHYFLHLDDAQGKTYSQKDGELIDAQLPTSQWQAGRVVKQAITLPAPAPKDWANYRLDLGWYDPAAGKRLSLPSGENHFALPLLATP